MVYRRLRNGNIIRVGPGVAAVAIVAAAVALVPASNVSSLADAAQPSADAAEPPHGTLSLSASPMTIGPTFGQHYNLVGGMDVSGEVRLAWRSIVGAANTIQVATIAPGAIEASPASAVSRDEPQISEPVLAIAPAGRAAIAWFDERETQKVGNEEILALLVRDQLPGGRQGPLQTVWRAPHRAGYEDGGLAVAVDRAGDEVVAWMTRRAGQENGSEWTLMVASRRAGGTFTTPTTLTTDSPDTVPAMAMSPSGEATVLRCSPGTCRQVLATTWPAGQQPSLPIVLDQEPQSQTRQEAFSDLQIESDEAGGGCDLAEWRTDIEPASCGCVEGGLANSGRPVRRGADGERPGRRCRWTGGGLEPDRRRVDRVE